ncbi:MAG: glycosyltransferase family 2 protein [Candidatus Nanoarchaeia archaeon]
MDKELNQKKNKIKNIKNKKKLLSIIIPTYNRKDCVLNAVNSILNQSKIHFDYEIIISDDGSTDNTYKLFQNKNKKVKYFWHENKGVNGARNFGIKKAKGDYFIFLDSDDELTLDAFEYLNQNEEKLGKINFFGTIERNTKNKMYYAEKTGKYNYKNWLKGDKIRGEFLPIVKREVFENDMYDEERFCFEGFFWNRVIKKYGVMVFDKPLRLYSFEQDNRVSKQLLSPEKSKKRYDDYQEYLKRFEKDYVELKLYKPLSKIFFAAGFYASLAGNNVEGRKYFLKSMKSTLTITNTLGWMLTFTGRRTFVKLAKIKKVKS